MRINVLELVLAIGTGWFILYTYNNFNMDFLTE